MNNLLSVVAIIALIACGCFGISRNYQPMWASFFAFGILLFFAYIDKISELRIGMSGFVAKTREVIEEAKSAIKELQSLSKIMASTTLGLVKRTGRWGGYSYDEKGAIKDSTVKFLYQIGVSEEEIKEVVNGSKWHEFVELDYTLYILGGSTIPKHLPNDRIPEWKELRGGGLDSIPTPEKLEQFLEQCGLLSDEAKELIKDYDHYIRCREQRRPRIWANRDKWNHLHGEEAAT